MLGLSAKMRTKRYATKQPAVYGYFAGGVTSSGAPVTATDRITFSTGATAANTASVLSITKDLLAGVSDLAIYGYFAGGLTATSVTTRVVTADRITFSTGAIAANTVSNLSQARYGLTGLSDVTTYGYFAGGATSAVVVTTDRITFSTGATAANTVSNVSLARSSLVGISDAITYGYFAGGTTSFYSAVADRIIFSTCVTSANTASNLSLARSGLAGLSDATTYGYFAGGITVGGNVATADRITFSTGVTVANTNSNLSQVRYKVSGLSDAIAYGYFVGGVSSGSTSVVTAERITFSTGVTVANTASNLSAAKSDIGSLSDLAV